MYYKEQLYNQTLPTISDTLRFGHVLSKTLPKNLFINVQTPANDITSRIDLLLADVKASLFRSLGCLAEFELENIILWIDVPVTWLFSKHYKS